MGNLTDDTTTKRTTMNVPKDVQERIRIGASRHRVSMSEMMRRLVEFWDDNHEAGERLT